MSGCSQTIRDIHTSVFTKNYHLRPFSNFHSLILWQKLSRRRSTHFFCWLYLMRCTVRYPEFAKNRESWLDLFYFYWGVSRDWNNFTGSVNGSIFQKEKFERISELKTLHSRNKYRKFLMPVGKKRTFLATHYNILFSTVVGYLTQRSRHQRFKTTMMRYPFDIFDFHNFPIPAPRPLRWYNELTIRYNI